MTPPAAEIDSAHPRAGWTFAEWCLCREVFSKRTYPALLLPLLVAGIDVETTLRLSWFPGTSRELFRALMWISACFLFAGGVRHASKAVCWELSNEMRELVRLTGIEASTVLWTQTASRWLTIILSMFLLLPLIAYTRTLGEITSDRWIAAGCGLLLVAVLTAAFAMVASVSATSAKNADTTAANTTVLLMLLYHCLFWAVGTILWLTNLSSSSLGGEMAKFSLELAPLTQLYRSIAAPEMVSPLAPTYWPHFLTAVFFMWLATVVMRNRFRAATSPQERSVELGSATAGAATPALLRPRCGDRPFFWKDTYILGGGAFSESLWCFLSFSALIGVGLGLASQIAYGNESPLVIGILLIGGAPWIVALQFDSLMAAEFRDKTWGSLMLLPVNPFEPIVSKVRAACWARRWIVLPVAAAAAIASIRHPFFILTSVTIASLSLPILVGISVLSQFNAKKWWAGSIVGVLVLVLIGSIVVVWVAFDRRISFVVTIAILAGAIAGFYSHIHWRLRNWSDE